MRRRIKPVSPHAPPLPSDKAGALMTRAAIASVAVSGILLIAKIAAYAMTGSVAVLAALIDSAVDLFASAVNFLAVRHALMPADAEHRFGHAKAEPLAGLAQAAFIAGSATYLLIESVNHLIAPHALTSQDVGIGVMAFAILLSLALVLYQRHVVRRTGSVAISSDNMHYAGDLLTNLGVIAGLVMSTEFGWLEADPLIGLAIVGVLLWSAWHVFVGAYDQLMDRELPDEARARIKEIALGHPEVTGLHDLRTRKAGTLSFIQLHLEMDPKMPLNHVHEVSDEVEARLLKAFPGAEILIHQDPAGYETPPPLATS